jgi:hypothetical protein
MNDSYEQNIKKFIDYSDRVAVVYGHKAENGAYLPFFEIYPKIDAAYEQFFHDENERTKEEFLRLASTLFDVAKFGNSQSGIFDFSDDIAKCIIQYYGEILDAIFIAQPFEDLAIKYRLSADIKASQLAKISSIINNYFSSVITESRELETRRSWLYANYSAYVKATGGNFDIGSIVKGFGMGALAAANPIIGIPAFIANWKFQSDKEKQMGIQVDNWVDQFGEFEDKISTLRKKIIDAAEKAKAYVIEKSKEVLGAAIFQILSDLKNKGYSTDHFFSYLDNEIKELESVEADIFSEV